MPIPGILASQIQGHLYTSNPAFDSIATGSPSGVGSYTFSSIPSTYKHLQLTWLMYGPIADMWLTIQYNGDGGSNYTSMLSPGATYQTNWGLLHYTQDMNNNSKPAFGTFDIYDYAGSNYKTSKSLVGNMYGGSWQFGYSAIQWSSTSAINSITVYARYGGNAGGGGTTFNGNTVFSLYGIKG